MPGGIDVRNFGCRSFQTGGLLPVSIEMMNRIRKTPKTICAAIVAVPAAPVNPKNPAAMAMSRNNTPHESIAAS